MTALAGTRTSMPSTVQQVREGVRASLLLSRRELRSSVRMPEVFIPNLLIPVVWFFIMVGSLDTLISRGGVSNWAGFQLPVAIVFATMSGSVGLNLVTDIERGYFDKLLLTPASRMSLLIGGMAGDLLRITAQGALVVALALLTGVDVATGLPGAVVMVLVAALWGLAFSAAGFAVALKTGSSQATQSMYFMFVPIMFLTTTFAPLDAMSGWLRAVAVANPVTYVLDALRALTLAGWSSERLGVAFAVIAAVGAVTISAAFGALRGRVR